MSVEGAPDGATFEAYVKHFLLPTLQREGQVVVMDNLQAHKSARVRNLIESAGASVLFLAPYSPDFSPIEEAFSKITRLSFRHHRGPHAGGFGGSHRPGARCGQW